MLHALAPSLEQCGVHVVVASAQRGNHTHLVLRSVTEPPTLDYPCTNGIYHWRYVLDELVRCGAERFILSSEACIQPACRSSVVRRLRCLQSEANVEVEIVGFVRPQWQWSEAYWCQQVACGLELRRFEECRHAWFADMRADYYELDYNQMFQPWRESFGRATIRPLEARGREALLSSFLGLIGIHEERLFRATTRLRPQNLRMGAKEVEIRRLVGRALARQGVEQLRRASAVYGLDLTGVLQRDWPFAGWTHEQALALCDHTAESNARFARDYGIDDDGILFRDELPRDFDDRGRPARWEDLSVVERKAARERVIRELNVDIENGSVGGGRLIRAGSAPRTRSISLARRLALEIWKRGKQVAGHAWRVTRATAQIRLSRKGFLFARWVRWEAYEFWRRQFGSLRWRFRRSSRFLEKR